MLLGTNPRHGINTPLFCLHTEQSGGIGEYPDLVPLIAWCHDIGYTVIQLLPLNDTGQDTSPYNAISSCALNPIHLGLNSLPGKDKNPELFRSLENLSALNAKPFIDYPHVNSAKMGWLRSYYNLMNTEIDYQNFSLKNPWVRGYALFKVLKEENGWRNWQEWGEQFNPSTKEAFEELYSRYQKQADFHIFVQSLCFSQMENVKAVSDKAGILLKGDIPILISPDSADVWLEPNLFHREFSAGAPPDMYSIEGQNWGFPLFNWKAMEDENYRWWIQRLKVAENFYHLYRIDHVVGFFRIWSIPRGEAAMAGCFDPKDENLWIPQGEKILRMMLENSKMLPIGEDLGVIPSEVRQSLMKLGICGTKVMRWERYWKESGQPYIPIYDYNPISLTTVSTHDSEPVNLWWANQPEDAKLFAQMKGWEYTSPLPLPYYQQILWDSHHTASLFHINLLQEYLGQFQDLHGNNSEEERINIPGLISNRNWSCRYLPSIEQFTKHQGLKQLMRDKIV